MPPTPQCLLCFLDDDYQAALRVQAQQGQTRHERALSEYKRLFTEGLRQIGNTANCPVHNQQDAQFAWWVDELLNDIRGVALDHIFDPLFQAYVLWVRGELDASTQALDTCMRKFGYHKRSSNELDTGVYFRGRSGTRNRDEMLHISFDDRHCISNQRYSLSGQPLLYLGLSIVDVVSELRGDPLNIGGYSFCYYWLREPRKVNILDLGNSIQNTIWNNLRPIIAAGSQIRAAATNGSQPGFDPHYPAYLDSFITCVIAAMCSFRRTPVTRDDKFAPEYVLPQLLAHWARKNSFDGIRYTSTRINGAQWRMSGYLKLNRYRENLAMFTHFDETSNDTHDQALLGKFEICDPIQLHYVTPISDADFKDLRVQIIQLHNTNPKGDPIHRAGIDLETSFQELVHVDAAGQQTPYADTDCGRVQRYLQAMFMRNQLANW